MRSHNKSFAAAVALWLLAPAAVAAQTVETAKTSGCGCCIAWVEHMEDAGYDVQASDVSMGALTQMKVEAGLEPDLHACHTSRIEGYVIEGHVPAREIDRLLTERPEAVGLAVPGMPAGSPGMDAAEAEPYDVLLVMPDGTTEVYASYE